ncbi:MAG TPA: homocysteine S-methyltransferase family protein, partial [Planococcus sp. (in: firmicutes)]|nr:homocysteine S-methyltransferase family protein [Planococcus sp. (in: firmicutes)]
MNPIEKILHNFPMIIVDGAMATELENYGCDLNDRLWSAKILMENPELIKKVHLDYFQAGADCAITASYQATIEGYQDVGLTEAEAILLIQKSVRLAAEARDEFWAEVQDKSSRPKPLVAASIGP